MTQSNLQIVDDKNFDRVVLGSSLPFLLDFTATWCGPCKALAPRLEQLASTTTGTLTVGKIDMDDAQETAVRFGVRAAPTLILFKNGVEVKRHTGLLSADKLAAWAR